MSTFLSALFALLTSRPSSSGRIPRQHRVRSHIRGKPRGGQTPVREYHRRKHG